MFDHGVKTVLALTSGYSVRAVKTSLIIPGAFQRNSVVRENPSRYFNRRSSTFAYQIILPVISTNNAPPMVPSARVKMPKLLFVPLSPSFPPWFLLSYFRERRRRLALSHGIFDFVIPRSAPKKTRASRLAVRGRERSFLGSLVKGVRRRRQQQQHARARHSFTQSREHEHVHHAVTPASLSKL